MREAKRAMIIHFLLSLPRGWPLGAGCYAAADLVAASSCFVCVPPRLLCSPLARPPVLHAHMLISFPSALRPLSQKQQSNGAAETPSGSESHDLRRSLLWLFADSAARRTPLAARSHTQAATTGDMQTVSHTVRYNEQTDGLHGNAAPQTMYSTGGHGTAHTSSPRHGAQINARHADPAELAES